MSINLVQCALLIIKNNSELAAPLYDALLFMAQPDAVLSPEYDETCEILYAQTPDSRSHRERYEKSRAA